MIYKIKTREGLIFEVNDINSNLKGFEPILDNSGKITGYKTNLGGADTVFPFRSSISAPESYVVDYVNGHGDATTLNPEFSGFEVGKQYFFIAACSTVLVDCEWVGSVKAYTGAVVAYFGIFTAKNSTLQLFKSGSFVQLNAKVFMLI